MDTLILVQDEAKLNKMVKEQPPQQPPGVPATDKLTVLAMGDPAAAAALGDTASLLGSTYLTTGIVNKIVSFADAVLANEATKPHPRDVAEFQILLLFHQTDAHMANAITRALEHIPSNKRWLRLPYKHNRSLRVTRVWIVSCESGADAVTRDPRLVKYIQQAKAMRTAARTGLTTEKTPPPSNPKEFWPAPTVYTFSTGDPVTGGLKLHPNHVSFVKTPDWHINDKGEIEPTPGGNPDKEEPAAGKVIKYDNGDAPSAVGDLPQGSEMDVLKQP